MAKNIEVNINQDNINVSLDRVNMDAYLPLSGGNMTGSISVPQDTAFVTIGDSKIKSENDPLWGVYYANSILTPDSGNKDMVFRLIPSGTAGSSVIELLNDRKDIAAGNSSRIVFKTFSNKFIIQSEANTNFGFDASKAMPIHFVTGNYGATHILSLLPTTKVGIQTSAPDKQLEINSVNGNCLRLTYNDANGSAVNYTDFNVSNNGTLTINASSGVINTGNKLTAQQYNISALNTAPASATATGTLGEIRVTSTHIYVCTATNTWKRTALETW